MTQKMNNQLELTQVLATRQYHPLFGARQIQPVVILTRFDLQAICRHLGCYRDDKLPSPAVLSPAPVSPAPTASSGALPSPGRGALPPIADKPTAANSLPIYAENGVDAGSGVHGRDAHAPSLPGTPAQQEFN